MAQKDATPFTEAANKTLLNELNWEDTRDFEAAARGFIASLDEPVITSDDGRPAWNLAAYPFLAEETAPPSVNPSLWRISRLNALYHGLFQVSDGIYQIRGFDLSVMSIIETDTGYIVVDPLVTVPTAKAGMELVYRHLGRKPIVAVIYTHSHIDHWGGVKGVISEEDVRAGKIKVIAPEHFLEHAISENVIAGNVMSRRASYMYGNLVPKGVKGQIGAGLGQTTSSGTPSLIVPTDSITATGQTMTIDGLEIEFQMTPGAEAPAEFNFLFPKYRALCMAENCSHNMHNLYTLRGAQVRDPKIWAAYLDEAIDHFAGRYDVIFASHHWPTWGYDACVDYLKKQRDMYKYLHDETLRLANQGYTILEIPEIIELPAELFRAWYNRGYYGSVNHNVKAVYQRYLGFFDGNPANLHPLPPEAAGKLYVDLAGGADALLAKARRAYDEGNYRWVAQVVNHLVFADPDNQAARQLQAGALEQMGYQAESGPWRNFYLSGAKELRDGVLDLPAPKAVSPDTVRATPLDMFFDLLAVRLIGPRAAGKTIVLNAHFTDIAERYVLTIENGVLNYARGKHADHADASLTTTRATLDQIALGEATAAEKLAAGEATIEGDPAKFVEFLSMLDTFEFWFNIVTP
ncbi:MAG: MBL fold metallo-hydrolase [Candidatus Promineofilum sp.]|jgi:alkyl sulfatase BDS1-like metallo-beta-lactamase superfamily hydrolase|nr:MBL fold metallo-hydrolase [Promineifilum sp.]